MYIDFHTHGKLAKKLPFSTVYTDWLFSEAKNAGLDALCLTNTLIPFSLRICTAIC